MTVNVANFCVASSDGSGALRNFDKYTLHSLGYPAINYLNAFKLVQHFPSIAGKNVQKPHSVSTRIYIQTKPLLPADHSETYAQIQIQKTHFHSRTRLDGGPRGPGPGFSSEARH